jgi:hypothetical protein
MCPKAHCTVQEGYWLHRILGPERAVVVTGVKA